MPDRPEAPRGGQLIAGQHVTLPRAHPIVGEIVWYLAYGTPGGAFVAGVPRAAIVTEVITPPDPVTQEPYYDTPGPTPFLSLAVLNPTGLYFNRSVPRGDAPGCWCWPTPTANSPQEA